MSAQEHFRGNATNSWVSPQNLSDHERYPSVVSSSPPSSAIPVGKNEAKILTNQGQHDNEGKILVPPYVGLEAGDNYPPGEHLDQTKGNLAHRQICGIRRRNFWIILAIIVIICAAVGGGVGGALAAKNKNNNVANSPSTGLATTTASITTSTSTSTSTSTTTPIPTTGLKIGSLAATYTPDETNSVGSSRLAIFYQDATTQDIVYRLLHNTSFVFQPPQKLPVTIQPRANSSLAAFATIASNRTTTISLYYFDSSSNIIEVMLQCLESSSSTDSTCSIMSYKNLSLIFNTPPHQQSSLSVIYSSNGDFGARLYYQDASGVLREALRFINQQWLQPKIIVTQAAMPGTPLSASMNTNANDLSVYVTYYDSGKALSIANYTSTVSNPDWTSPVRLVDPGLTDSSIALASATEIVSGSRVYTRVYYATNDARLRENSTQITLNKISPTWSAAKNGYDVSTGAVGGIASVSWLNNVRVFFVSSGIIRVATLSDTDGGAAHWDLKTIDNQ